MKIEQPWLSQVREEQHVTIIGGNCRGSLDLAVEQIAGVLSSGDFLTRVLMLALVLALVGSCRFDGLFESSLMT